MTEQQQLTPMHQPRLPVPAPLRGTDPDSFAADTIKRRLPDIARRVLAENELTPAAAAAMVALIDEIPRSKLRPLRDDTAPDHALWQPDLAARSNQNWLQAPWFFAETYFYRRIIEAVAYFETGADPYHHQKRLGLHTEQVRIAQLAQRLSTALAAGWQPATCRHLLVAALWGNQADLSMWTANAANKPDHDDESARQAHTLVDDSTAVAAHLQARSNCRVDFISDNAGIELVADLLLSDYLLTTGKAGQVSLHLKLHPTFVSDVILADVDDTVAFLRHMADPAAVALGLRVQDHLNDGRLQLENHPFWTSPRPLWQLPPDLRRQLAAADLVISKGDANYRRALGDAHWQYDTPVSDVISYFPAPLVELRTCKSDVLAGLPPGRQAELDRLEPGWDVNGRWGVIQFLA